MTDTPLHRSAEIQSEDHNRGLHHTLATVAGMTQPTALLTRVTLQIPGLQEDPEWCRPNVALRFYLSPEFGEASRIYTVRAVDLAAGSIEVDVVRHGVGSPMMRWLAAIEPGTTVELVGPRPHFQLPPATGRPVALFLDGTAIPALYAILSDPPAGLRGTGWVATEDAAAFAELPAIAGLTLHRIAPGQGFEAQFRGLAEAGEHVVWGAGERDEMKAVRSFFRNELGLPKEEVAVFGYWKRGTSNTEIDAARLQAYQELLATGGELTELDDLGLAV